MTCNGYAPSQGRRCRNPINQANRSTAQRMITELPRLAHDPQLLFQRLLKLAEPLACHLHKGQAQSIADGPAQEGDSESHAETTDEDPYANASSDDEPPEFDLRTGRYVSHSRPMGRGKAKASSSTADGAASTGKPAPAPKPSSSLIQRAKGDIASVNGAVSPGAEFLRSQRTWKGLGSDYSIEYERDENGKIRGAPMEEGRAGVARGYAVAQEREG